MYDDRRLEPMEHDMQHTIGAIGGGHDQFHERENHHPYKATSDRNENSLSHRWATTVEQCSKFIGSHDQMVAMAKGGMGKTYK